MIFLIIEFLVLIVTMGFVWYYLDSPMMNYIDYWVNRNPSAFNMEAVAFMKGIWHFFLFFMLIGGSYYIFVYAQREKTPEGYYP